VLASKGVVVGVREGRVAGALVELGGVVVVTGADGTSQTKIRK
jgi:hypothetical protein